jgi:hypothetical protein
MIIAIIGKNASFDARISMTYPLGRDIAIETIVHVLDK